MTVTRNAPRPLRVDPERPCRALGYYRVSRLTVTEGEKAGYAVTRGVKRQERDANRLSEEKGTGPVDGFTDEGESASEFARKERTNWPAFLEAVASGVYTHVYIFLLDRTLRQADDVSALLKACRQGGAVIVQTATRSVIDPWNPEDVKHARNAGTDAEYEVAKMSMRQLSAKEDAAKAGQPHGGRKRFGYKRKLKKGRLVIHPAEAAIIRELVDRYLTGESLYSLARWLRETGVKTPQGGTWAGPNMGRFLAGPHLAGLRIHQGEVIGKGEWPAIISVAEHEAIKAKLGEAKKARAAKPYTNARRYELAGLALCQACGGAMRGKLPSGNHPAGYVAYACETGRHVHRPVASVDKALGRLMVHRLSLIDASNAFRDTEAADRLREAEAALGAIPAKRRTIAAQWAADEITDTERKEMTDALSVREAALRADLALAAENARRPERVLAGMTGTLPEAEAAWEAADIHKRRAVIDHLAWVFVKGAGKTGGRPAEFDPEKDLVIIWR